MSPWRIEAGKIDAAKEVDAEIRAIPTMTGGGAAGFRIDFEIPNGAKDGQETQKGWTSWEFEPTTKPVTRSSGGIEIKVSPSGGSRIASRGSKRMKRSTSLRGTSWNEMVEDCLTSRGGDGRVIIGRKGLSSSTTYTLTSWRNGSFLRSINSQGGEVEAEMIKGDQVGADQKGANSALNQTKKLDDSAFKRTVIRFKPESDGTAEIRLQSNACDKTLNLSGLQLSDG